MTRNYNRTEILSFFELSEREQSEVLNDFSMEISDAEDTQYAIIEESVKSTAIPLNMFMRTNSNFTHGIFSDSYFSGYFLTLSRCGTQGVIAYKYF
jgi:hypothetical protein